MTSAARPAGESRRDRRKAETRSKLIAAARELFATAGVDATRINEITEAADVGFGSFYNHFDGKDAIVAAVAEQAIREVGEAIADATADLPDAAEVVAAAHRTVIAHAVADPDLGWLLVRLELSHDLATRGLGPFAARDLQRGIDDGRFTVGDPTAVLIASGGALLGTIRAVLQGRTGATPDVAGQHHAAAVLRMLGVPGLEADEIARRPLPTGSLDGGPASS